MMPTLALLEAFDRHGALLARAPITRWPVTVGRSLACDLVLDDPHVAPTHLHIDRAADAPRTVSVEVQPTLNGALLQRQRHGSALTGPTARRWRLAARALRCAWPMRPSRQSCRCRASPGARWPPPWPCWH